MSVATATKPVTTRGLCARKGGEPIVCLTAYTAPMACLLDAEVAVLLAWDSLGMVVYGLPTTIGVTLEMMINHGAAVVRAAKHACCGVDLPFGAYQENPEQAFRNSARVMMKTGCAAVKLEGGTEMAAAVRFLVEHGIPVMAHIGLTPQAVHALGGFVSQGKAEAEKIFAAARAEAEAGAFAVVVEGVQEALGRRITEEISVPAIGIGASPARDAQVLVIDDLLGLFSEFKPKFVKRSAELAPQVTAAVRTYAAEVKSRVFPAPEHCFGVKR